MTEALKTHINNSSKVPRYTSYPTAPYFNEEIDSETVKLWLNDLHKTAKTASLYVHIPFCEKLCLFCGCNMKIINTYSPVQQYLQIVEKEIELISKELINCPPITHLHFGGGSPTALSADDFRSFMKVLKKYFPIDDNTDIAVEIDPRTVDLDKMTAYTDCGMNRISLGVQDFNQKVQEAVNRVQPYDLVKNVIDVLKEKGVKSINIDLMYGLPFQTVETIKTTIEQVLTLSPERLSIFGYAHVPWMKPHQRLIPEEALAGMEERLLMFEEIKKGLVSAGYVAVGLDHFAKSTDKMASALISKEIGRNFQGYTTDTADSLIGIGHTSIGFMPQGYMQNYIDPVEYKQAINEGRLPIKKGYAVTAEDIIRREIINNIMCYMEVDLKAFGGVEKWQNDVNKLQPLLDDNLITMEDGIITVPDSSRSILRIIASAFDAYLNDGVGKHSSAV